MGAERIAVIGNGIIGHGVTQVFAAAGHPVQMIGRNQASLDTALAKIKASLDEFVANGILTKMEATAAIGRIATGTELGAVRDAAMVIEAVTEDLPLKLKIFGELDALCGPQTIPFLVPAAAHSLGRNLWRSLLRAGRRRAYRGAGTRHRQGAGRD